MCSSSPTSLPQPPPTQRPVQPPDQPPELPREYRGQPPERWLQDAGRSIVARYKASSPMAAQPAAVIRCGVHAGSHTGVTSTVRTPGSCASRDAMGLPR